MVKKQEAKRKRGDTFWHYTDQENGDYFDTIFKGKHPLYGVRVEQTKKDYNGKDRNCWLVYNTVTMQPVSSIRSTKPYRLAMIWSVTSHKYWRLDKRKQRVIDNLPKIRGKKGLHSRHRCGNDWCTRPSHIQIGTRKDNEVDKHFHYFLNHPDPTIRKRFLKTFSDLARKQRVW